MPMIRCEKLTKACLAKFRRELVQYIESSYPEGGPVSRFSSGQFISSASEDYILLQAIERARQSLREKANPPEAK